jgi:hypothetical protein
MPVGYDAEVAELFRDLRAATALSEIDLAGRLGTRADVVQALEQGALYALPPWAETCRVVNAYGALLNLDVRPLLRRIYAQLESGIVGLQPKTMPDVPVMTPPEPQDYSFAPRHAAGAPATNPLDIPWPPPAQQAPPPRNAWPNAPQSPQPQPTWQPAPQMPQPQHAWQNAQSPQGRPGSQPQPQAQRPNVAPQRRAPPQQQAADRRAPPPRAPQAQAPQPQAQARQMPPRQAPPPEPSPLDVDFGPAPLQPTPEPEKPRRRARLLKWGLGVLIVSVVAFGLWMTLTHAPGPSGPGAGNAPSGTLDPDDPRSRKADRLPSPF